MRGRSRTGAGRGGRVGLASCALLAVAGCGVSLQTTRDAYLEPDALAPPSSARAWEPPPEAGERVPGPTRATAAPADAEYDLPTLVDVALRENPRTREAWEAARVKAATFGRAMGRYLPDVAFEVDADYSKYLFESSDSPARIKQYAVTPLLRLEWLLFDFGRRDEAVESARRQLLAANLEFNRALQEVVFAVQSAYYALEAAHGMKSAAERNLESALSVREAADERFARGLATRPDVLLADQSEARAAYELESARVLVSDAEADLALAVGIPADRPIAIADRHDEPIPPELERSVDALIDEALADRPDLAARVEALRAQEATAREAEAELYPQIFAAGSYGVDAWWYRFSGPPTIRDTEPVWNAGVGLRWSIFEGFDRLNTIREANAETARVRAELEEAELETIAQVWRAYHDQRSAARKYDYAKVLLESSREAYRSNFESYRHGLATIVDVLAAERDLAEARYILIQSRAELLTQAARVAYVVGAMPSTRRDEP